MHSTNSFYAWVPSVSGRLSFQKIGETSHPNECKKYSAFDPAQKLGRIYCTQIRYTGDAEFSTKFSQKIFSFFGGASYLIEKLFKADTNGPISKIGYFFTDILDSINLTKNETLSFHLAGEWSDGKLIGHIGVEQRHSHHKMRILKPLRDLAHSEWKKQVRTQSKEKSAHEAYENAIKKCIHHARFELERTGVLYLEISDDIIDQESGNPSLRAKSILAGEIYFFLKEIVHTHKHHDKNSDRVIDIYPVTDRTDYSWAPRVRANLNRHLIEKQRTPPFLRSMQRTIGMSAYCESFERIISEVDTNLPRELVNYDLLRTSVESKISEIQTLSSAKEQRITTTFATAGLAFSIIAIYASTKGFNTDSIPQTYRCFLQEAVGNFDLIIGILLIMGVAYLFPAARKYFAAKVYRKLASSLYHLLASLPKPVQVTIWISTSLICFYLGLNIGKAEKLPSSNSYGFLETVLPARASGIMNCIISP